MPRGNLGNRPPSHNTDPQQELLEINKEVSMEVDEAVHDYRSFKFETATQVVDNLEALRTMRADLPVAVGEGAQVDPTVMKGLNRELRLGVDKFVLAPGSVRIIESVAAGSRPLHITKDVWDKMQKTKDKDPKVQAQLDGLVSDAKRRLSLSEDVRLYKIAHELADDDIVPVGKNHRSYVMRETGTKDKDGKPKTVPLRLNEQHMEVLHEHKDQILGGVEETTKERLAHEQGIRDANLKVVEDVRREDRRKISEMIGHFPGDMQSWLVERGITPNSQNVAKYMDAYKVDYTKQELGRGHKKPNFEKPKPAKTERLRDAIGTRLARAAVAVAVNVPAGVNAVPVPAPNAAPVAPQTPAAPGAEQAVSALSQPEAEETLAQRVVRLLGHFAVSPNIMYYWHEESQTLWADTKGVLGGAANAAEPAQPQPVRIKYDANGNVIHQSKRKPSKHQPKLAAKKTGRKRQRPEQDGKPAAGTVSEPLDTRPLAQVRAEAAVIPRAPKNHEDYKPGSGDEPHDYGDDEY